jgi:filamentous hemagglutinin
MRERPRRKFTWCPVALLIAVAASAQGASGPQLPVPCLPGACGASTNSFVTPAPGAAGSPTVSAVQTGNTLTINQASNSAILNWASFNVGAGGHVTFNQPTATSVALNRIFQSSPSAIFGQVTANGQIYLINPNGFVFGATAQVNASGLIASSLGMTNNVFNAGVLAPEILSGSFGSKAALSGDVGADGNTLPGGDPASVTISVQNGAQISVPGGRLLLAAPNVQNAGSLSAPDGQVVLAAGQNVYLQASNDPTLRGLIVEVDGNNAAALNQLTTVTNESTGVISTPRGNITMVGLAVNQEGRLSATTSVSANGSIRLEAGSQALVQGGGGNNPFTVTSQQGGTLELGPQSSTDVLPELGSTATAVADQVQMPSQISLLGQVIDIDGGNITAPNASLQIIASAAPGLGVRTDGNTAAQIRVNNGSTIDLSGSSAELPVSANLLAIQLRANELADDPDQRNGPLHGQTVYVDARVGSPLINAAAFSSALDAVPESVAQRTESGGTATFESEGDVVIGNGATINVSGGKTTYDGGAFQTSLLVGTNGQLYGIGTANPSLPYTGVVNPTFTQTFNQWGVQTIVATPGLTQYEAGYVQGAPAGMISIAAPALVVQGSLIGTATNGILQRSSGAVPGGQLVIGLPGGLSTATGLDFLAPSVEFVPQPIPIVVGDNTPLIPQPLLLPTAYLTSGGFTSTKIYSNGVVTLPAGVPLNLNPGGSLLIDAPRVDIDSNITAAGGTIELETALTIGAADSDIARLGIDIGDGVTLDVSGQWTNDYSLALAGSMGTGQILQNGGIISLSAGSGAGIGNAPTPVFGSELVIGNDVALRANGGAWLQSNDTLTGGKGGSITLSDAPLQAALQLGSGAELEAFGVAGGAGGSFTLTAPRLLITNGGATWAPAQRVDDLAPAGAAAPGGVFDVSNSLFDRDGFSSVTLIANGPMTAQAANTDILTLASGTTITAQTQTLALLPTYTTQPTGANLDGFAQPNTLPVGIRPVTNVSLSVAPTADDASLLDVGLLDIQAGASIVADPGASIALSGVGGVYVDGTLSAPGGAIALATQAPIGTPDPGYLPNLRIELGPQAVLDAGGTFVPTLNNQNLALGSVLAGGSVSLLAGRGSVVTDPGSQINIDGTSHSLDVPTQLSAQGYTLYDASSAGGSLIVRAPESISMLGQLDAHAGAGNYGDPAAGSLEVDLTRSEFFSFPADPTLAATFPTTPRIIELISTLPPNATASDPGSGQAVLGVAQLAASGIDSLRLEAGDEIVFASNTPLTLSRQLILDAPAIGVGPGINALVTTNYAALGNTLPSLSPAVAAPGTGNLTVNAQQIDLMGSFVLQNIANTSFNSAGDITLRDVYSGSSAYGNLGLDGNLVLSAARVYPTTDSAFSIATQHLPGDPLSMIDTVSITQSGPSPGTPLSAYGSVSINADQITSSGTLVAPFGSISLGAVDSLNLESGSVTSVSGAGLMIPFGATQLGGQQWIYTPTGGDTVQISGAAPGTVSLNAPAINVAGGATVNLRGGGDVYAYEWVPGTGGTVDALGQNAATGLASIPGLYAVLPSLQGQFAPYDPEESPPAGLASGASIYLSGIAGLPAGIYPLLPARDALVPGAFLVQVQTSGYSTIVPGQPGGLSDGTPVIAGYLTFGTTGLHSGGYQGVAIWPGSYAQSLAQYQISDASSYFAAIASASGAPRPPSPADAGALSIDVSSALNFLGQVLGNAPNSSGLGSKIDISAPQLEVTASDSSGGASGAVTLSGSVIQSWAAGQLVLGGQPSSDGTTIGVSANSVTIDDGAQVSANQVIIVANQAINVQPGASVLSSSASAGGAAPQVLPAATPLTLTGANSAGAAMLAVSDLSLPIVQRTGAAAQPATITVGQGATVGSLGALSLDAPGGIAVSGTLSGTGATWSLASASIGFVGSGSSTDALQIDSALQSALSNAASIRLASDGAINLYAPVLLGDTSASGSPTLSSLTLAAGAIVNQGAAGGSIFGAKSLTLEGSPGASAGATPTAATGGGSVSFIAGELNIGAGTETIAGFQNTSIQASSAVVGQAVGSVVTGGNLSITAPLVTAVGGAQTGLGAPFGTLMINSAPATGTPAVIPNNLGGEVDLNANAMQLSASLIVPAGNINVQATQDIDVTSSTVLDAGGRTVMIDGQSVGAEGGAVRLVAGGNLNLAPGSSINVSGAGDAPAGSITITAGGSADIGAGLSGQAGAGAQGGSFSVEAGTLVEGLTPLANALQTGGFTAANTVIAHSGNLLLSPGAALTANQISLVADAGSIDVEGTLTAPSAGLRGNIGVFGAAGVNVGANAQLSANTVGGAGIGGEIDLGTGSGGTIVLAAGSALSAAGSSATGTLLVRAPISGNDVAVINNGTTLDAFNQIIVEPIITMPIGSTLSAAQLTAIESSAASTVASVAPTVQASLNPTGTLPLIVRAAVDLTQTGALELTNSLDLYPSSVAGVPLDLSFRIGGSITIGSVAAAGAPTPVTISDGFSTTNQSLSLSQSPSSSFRFVAGADASSPDPLAVVTGSAQSLTLGTGTIIRTGTGEIDLEASGDIVFSSPGVSGGNTPLVYTAGVNPMGSPGQPISAITVPGTSYVFNFPTQGGAIRVNAGGDIQGAAVQESVAAWQLRQGSGSKPAEWGVDLDQLGWNISSLGGGDVSIQAAGSISELSAAAADSYYHPKNTNPIFTPSGGLQVAAGGDIGSSQFFLADGTGSLRAGGAFSAVEPVQGSATDVGSLLALDNAQIVVEARTGLDIDAIVNPTASTESLLDSNGRLLSYFFTYGAQSGVVLQTTGGNVSLNANSLNQQALMGTGAGTLEQDGPIYPGTLIVRSLLGDVSLSTGTLFPSASGQLAVIAGQDVIGNGTLTMSDAALDIVPTAALPAQDPSTLASGTQVPFSADLHVNDPQPALVVAGRDIDNLALQVPKPADVIAGRDIVNLQYEGQNLQPGQLTLVSAGRDVIDNVDGGSEGIIQVGGPGRLDVLAGRNVNLGFSSGITTVGDTVNPNLPTASGADLTVSAGLGQAPAYAQFLSTIIAPNLTNQGLLINYVESLTGQSGLSYAQAQSEFSNLDADQQRPLIDQVFFDQLSASGLQANTDPQAGYSLGYAAIDALFPDSRAAVATGPSPYQGDISLTFSRIYTLSGGMISLLAPGGELDVGLANPPASLGEQKAPSQLGIVAQGLGDVDIYTKGDVNVNSSRIFTLGGGNILIWSDEGSIDAGRGSKSSVSAPPPQVLVDAQGNITLSFSGAVAGSGIRTIQIDPSVNPGNVNLVAPEGTVNAGDAGIGAAGNINIAAEQVLGVSNIQFGGTATGVPAQVSSIGASLSGASNAAGGTSNASTAAAESSAAANEAAATPLAASALSFLEVFVTGLGEENCRPDDTECLRRQATSAH